MVETLQWLDLRTAAARFDPFQAGIGAYARALTLWQQRTRYCGVCASALVLTRAGHVAHCPACDIDHFPRTDPAVIVVISNGDSILLARQASWPESRSSLKIGSASCRERGCKSVYISVVAVQLKKKTTKKHTNK